MKSAFQKDEALLADIAATRQDGGTRIWWLGQSGFLLTAAGKTVLLDPYLSDSLTKKYATTDKPHVRITERVISPRRLTGVDLITSSHVHTDHLDAETLVPLLEGNPAAKLLIPRANRWFVLDRLGDVSARLLELDAVESLTCNGVRFTGVASAHNEIEKDESGQHKFLGYIVQCSGLTVYHSGDSLAYPGLVPTLKAYAPDLVLLPINGNKPERRVAGNMDGAEAATVAKEVAAKLVIPHHFDMFEFNTASPDPFEAECRKLGQPFRTLRNGEGMDLNL